MSDGPDGSLHIGGVVGADHQRTGEDVRIDASSLTTHGLIVGMTGSGKTGLGVALVEEALLEGVPVLVLDPKGDLGNLALTFPDLDAASFAPWVEGGDDPAEVAGRWKEGLAGWGIDGARLQALRDAAPVTIYTPGSTSGVGLDVVGRMTRPAEGADPESVVDEASGYVSGLLALVGIEADPLASREHILLTTLVQAAWAAGQDLDLAGLVGQVQRPPIRKLGVFELDEFFPPADRTALALRLNGLLASPAFAAWGQGVALDIDALLRPGGRPACAVVSMAHLADDERQMVVTLVLSKLVTWMRSQPGTDELRVLVYFDEVAGYVPPVAAPPAKAPILTLFKQARAFGVGVVLATQNPVDMDYKALSNAGTWLIGRLQTEQDKARLLDGLSSADGGVDTAAVGATIAGLEKREFVLRQAGRPDPTLLTSRWAMSYLRGPLTREQIATVMADQKAATVPPAPPAPTAPSAAPPADAATAPAAAAEGDDATPVVPTVAEGIPVRWLDPAAPWAAAVGASPTGTRHRAAVAATVDLLYDDTKADLRHTERFECVLVLDTAHPDPATAVAVDHDPRDLRAEPPSGATYEAPEAAIRTKALFTTLRRGLVDHLRATRTVTIWANPELKVYGRPGEAEAEVRARVAAAADTGADAEGAKVAARYAGRIQRARAAVATAEDKVRQADQAAENRRQDELARGATAVLGGLLGGRGGVRSIIRAAGGAVARHGRAGEAASRADAARNRVGEKAEALADLEAEVADALAAITEEWDAKEAATTALEVPLERTDITVVDLALVWIPVR
ncbi:ATP-binding protein [Iamia sp. SCSIO 61187]|uniref:helicase HerA-like domain-containing protein n=1 Tax=Iamia sp. SCSIO 61187 TaxID=2722752 RepID=UPI001C637193|nr:helicase HerA-like domain-containing protein [Iamia sp. SCSIO 61187]QYG93052.1 ATP-binding protein [Iamia sp. SCSIO 61187]